MKSKIAVVKVHPQALEPVMLERVGELMKLLGGVGKFCRKGDTILVKPNISMPEALQCVSPSVTWAVAKLFSDYGCEVLIGEDPPVFVQEDEAYSQFGLHQVAQKAHAKVVSLRYGPHTKVKVPRDGFFSEIEISTIALEADFVVSVATMKTVNVTTVSLGLKNIKGLIRPSWKRKFHCEGLNQGIVDLNATLGKRLSIIDATFGRDTSARVCYPVGLLMGSGDPVAADAVCARIMGFDPERIEHIKGAWKAGLGALDSGDIEIQGEKIEDWMGRFPFSSPKNPFELAATSGGKIRIIQGKPCSACLNELGESLALCEDQLEDMPELTILVGPEAEPNISSEHLILFGNCLQKHRSRGIYVGGCPPSEYEPLRVGSLKEVLIKILQGKETRLD